MVFKCGRRPCACRVLDPAILMMKSTKNRDCDQLTERLDRSKSWHIFVQRQVRSQSVVVVSVSFQDPTQVVLAQDHDVIQGLPTDRANQPLCIAILPG